MQKTRSSIVDIQIPNDEEFRRGLHKKLNPMYKLARDLVGKSWGNPSKMVEGVGVLLLTWNQVFYGRFGWFDFDELEGCIADNYKTIEAFRKRDIFSLSPTDENDIRDLFINFLKATRGRNEKSGVETKTPVGVSKTLHLLAPKFFPMWDTQIAKDYRCYYYSSDKAADKYICFCKLIKEVAEKVKAYPKDRTLVKLIDEYNHKTRSKKGKKQYKVQQKVS
jgi:hypothetical protein